MNNQSNDYKILSLYIVFGFFIMIGYGLMIKKYPTNTNSVIWSNKNRNIILNHKLIKYTYLFMIFLSFVAGPYLIYYLTTNQFITDTNEILIYVGSVLFLVCSTVWAFFPFECSKIILGFVAIGAILILAGICTNEQDPNDPKKIAALLAISIIVLQTSLFDFAIWNGIYPFNIKKYI